jgi:hypothetical protein
MRNQQSATATLSSSRNSSRSNTEQQQQQLQQDFPAPPITLPFATTRLTKQTNKIQNCVC